jgi:chromosome segregation ATPase
MQSIRVANQILLGSVAFGVSFILGLGMNRDISKALLTGIITVPAAYAGVFIAEKRRISQEKLLRSYLHNQIQELEAEEAQLYHSLASATATRQEIEASINALHGERVQLLGRVSELHNQRNKLYKELSDFQKQKQQQEVIFYKLQSQIQQLERQQNELNQSLSAKTFQLNQTENRINQLNKELEKLQVQVSAKKQQNEQLHPKLSTLESRKQHLEGEAYDLQTQIQVLQQRQNQLNQLLAPLQAQKLEIEASLMGGKTRLDQLLSQISEKQKQQKKLNEELANLKGRKQQLEVEFQQLKSQLQGFESQPLLLPSASSASNQNFNTVISTVLPQEWQEWLEFYQQLSEDEQQVFQAILEQDATKLKQIADEKSTMTEVLIEAINETALNIFGDTLFVSNGSAILPDIYEDYASIFKDPIALYFKDLLGLYQNPYQFSSIVTEKSENSRASV